MTDQIIKCPDCASPELQKYGKTPAGAQKYRCVAIGCRRQFIIGSDHLIKPMTKETVLAMIAADIEPRKIYQAVNEDGPEKISLRWIYELRRKAKNG